MREGASESTAHGRAWRPSLDSPLSLPSIPLARALSRTQAFHALATAAVERPASGEGAKLTFATIRQRMSDVMYKITSQKFEDPAEGEAVLRARFAALSEEISKSFKARIEWATNTQRVAARMKGREAF